MNRGHVSSSFLNAVSLKTFYCCNLCAFKMLVTMQLFKPVVLMFTLLILLMGSVLLYSHPFDSLPQLLPVELSTPPTVPAATTHDTSSLRNTLVEYFEDYPLTPPHKENFGELGRRTRLLKELLILADHSTAAARKESLKADANRIANLLYPFLARPGTPSRSSLTDLRDSFIPGSSGIVIPVGNHNVRYAAHLIRSLRNVLKSTLPIQIVYAGDDDLSAANRDFLAGLPSDSFRTVRSITKSTPNDGTLEFIDILTIFDDSALKLKTGGWAIKPFAALGSTFEKVILLDADAVFVQKPEVLFEHPAFQRSGAFLFRDRLLWQHAFQDRHTWWKTQIKRPSATLDSSLVWTQDYAEEGDSGVVVVDKSRTDAGILVGLLHICWQNSYAVREEVTYKITYGDKESWWLGFELSGSTYEMEAHYGAIIGWEESVGGSDAMKVCSFTIAHFDDESGLIWYNGGLLKNKQIPEMKHEYAVPDKWMVDAVWEKGALKTEMSCMIGGGIHNVPDEQQRILELSIVEAQWVDEALGI